MMKNHKSLFLITYLAFSLLALSCVNKFNSIGSDHSASIYDGLEFPMEKVKEPVIPEYSVNIIDFGAVPDGQTLNTRAFADAIQEVSNKGGGKVIVPRGIWLTGPIVMKSNINLHTENGALILFSRNFDDYPLIETSFEGLETHRCLSPIYAYDLDNIAITGEGIIDGSGDAWRPVKKSKMTSSQWKQLIQSGGILNEQENTWYPSEKSLKGTNGSIMNVPAGDLTRQDFEAIKDFLRPVMISIVKCRNVLLDGPTFQNSPAWNIHPLMCDNITIRNLSVKNPWYSQNGDGLDLESCKNAIIYNCNFDVGDDAICFKSGKNETGRRRGIPTENVIVKGCVVYHGHGGFVVGSEMSGGVRNVHVSNCTFMGTDVGLRFKSTRGRGGIVENIYISNITMTDIPTEPIHFNLYYGGNSPVPEPDEKIASQDKTVIPPVSEETPRFRNIYMKNIVCKGAGRAAILQGLPEMNLSNVSIENAVLEADRGMDFFDADGIQLKNVFVKATKGPVLEITNTKNLYVENFTYEKEGDEKIRIRGSSSANIRFKDVAFTMDEIESDEHVDRNAVIIE
ncbi:MAG TPA: glycoside hydrolase family 28 protein [Bacteroidales bacterium]|nr:glycoside hydrolase family 28 protein [Bacteroidales bacterium]